MSEQRSVSVVVPTVGRPALLSECLRTIVACRPPPAEVVVVDQSATGDVDAVVRSVPSAGTAVRRVACTGPGIARALNAGLRGASHDVVLVTNDDCTVAPDWVGVASAAMDERPGGIVTGRVLAAGDPDATPSTKADPEPHDFTGEPPTWVLYGGNMALPRADALAIGGFDERRGLAVAAEDNDFCYRWMDAGRPLRYEPALVVWHHDWRTPAQLQRRYRAYARGQGAFYAKHLYAGDRRVLPALRHDLRAGARALARDVVRRRLRRPDEQRALLVGVPLGLVQGWRESRRITRAHGAPAHDRFRGDG